MLYIKSSEYIIDFNTLLNILSFRVSVVLGSESYIIHLLLQSSKQSRGIRFHYINKANWILNNLLIGCNYVILLLTFHYLVI